LSRTHVAVIRRNRASRFDIETCVVLGRLEQRVAGDAIARAAQEVVHAIVDFLLRDLTARFGELLVAASDARAVQHRDRFVHFAARGRLARLRQQQSLALLADLRGEERDTHVIRFDAACHVGEPRGFFGPILEERFLGGVEQPIHHALDADDGTLIVALATKRLTIELNGIFARRRDERASPQCGVRTGEQRFELRVVVSRRAARCRSAR